MGITQGTLRERERRIQKLLLFNAYPIGYILLWIPGILNRLLELGGGSSRALAIAQSSTQFVGLANALVYGYNERIWGLARAWWRDRKERQRMEKQRKRDLRMWREAESYLDRLKMYEEEERDRKAGEDFFRRLENENQRANNVRAQSAQAAEVADMYSEPGWI